MLASMGSSPAAPAIPPILARRATECQNVTIPNVYRGLRHFHPAARCASQCHALTACA